MTRTQTHAQTHAETPTLSLAADATERDDGLENVVAAHTVLSDVDGANGRLVIRGRTLDEIAGRWSYEDMLAHLFEGFFAPRDDAGAWDALALQRALGAARAKAFEAIEPADALRARKTPPVEAMRALLARLADGDGIDTALRSVAGVAVFTAAVARWRQGREAVAPDASLSHAADFLRMHQGEQAAPAAVAALDTYLVTVADHGLNASTFAARVVASTLAGLGSASLAGLSALKGPLHGGAPGPVLDMLDAIGKPEAARTWIEAALARGERLMGFGHRVYRVRDPRADALKRALRRLGDAGAFDPQRLRLAEGVEQAALAILREQKQHRALDTNVEFYTALLLESLGFGRESFTCVFAAGRVGGWIAHAREQVATRRLVRPRSVYVGPVAS